MRWDWSSKDIPGVAVTGHQIEQVGTGDVKGPPEAESIKVRSQDDSQLLPVWIVHILLSDLVGLGVHVDGVVGLAAHVVLPDDAALLSHLHRYH